MLILKSVYCLYVVYQCTVDVRLAEYKCSVRKLVDES